MSTDPNPGDAGPGAPTVVDRAAVDRAAVDTAAVDTAAVDTAAVDAVWLAEAVALATRNVAENGGPFGAVIVADGTVLARGTNRVTSDLDPTAHAEVTAIRAACRSRGDFSLAGATLYTSCEPCPLCVSASLWARLDRVVFAADRHDAAAGGFDDREFYELFARDRDSWPTRVEAHAGPLQPPPQAPFDAWLAKADRVDY